MRGTKRLTHVNEPNLGLLVPVKAIAIDARPLHLSHCHGGCVDTSNLPQLGGNIGARLKPVDVLDPHRQAKKMPDVL